MPCAPPTIPHTFHSQQPPSAHVSHPHPHAHPTPMSGKRYTSNPHEVIVPVEQVLHAGFQMEAAALPPSGHESWDIEDQRTVRDLLDSLSTIVSSSSYPPPSRAPSLCIAPLISQGHSFHTLSPLLARRHLSLAACFSHAACFIHASRECSGGGPGRGGALRGGPSEHRRGAKAAEVDGII